MLITLHGHFITHIHVHASAIACVPTYIWSQVIITVVEKMKNKWVGKYRGCVWDGDEDDTSRSVLRKVA